MSGDEFALIADAFKTVTETLKRIHTVFMWTAFLCLVVIVSFITGAAWFIVTIHSNSEMRAIDRHGRIVEELKSFMDGLRVNQHQSVNINRPKTHEDLVEEELIRRRNKDGL